MLFKRVIIIIIIIAMTAVDIRNHSVEVKRSLYPFNDSPLTATNSAQVFFKYLTILINFTDNQ